jgi:hypothetical protein
MLLLACLTFLLIRVQLRRPLTSILGLPLRRFVLLPRLSQLQFQFFVPCPFASTLHFRLALRLMRRRI